MATRISWEGEHLYLHITGNDLVEIPEVLMEGTRFIHPFIGDYDPAAGSIAVQFGREA